MRTDTRHARILTAAQRRLKIRGGTPAQEMVRNAMRQEIYFLGLEHFVYFFVDVAGKKAYKVICKDTAGPFQPPIERRSLWLNKR